MKPSSPTATATSSLSYAMKATLKIVSNANAPSLSQNSPKLSWTCTRGFDTFAIWESRTETSKLPISSCTMAPLKSQTSALQSSISTLYLIQGEIQRFGYRISTLYVARGSNLQLLQLKDRYLGLWNHNIRALARGDSLLSLPNRNRLEKQCCKTNPRESIQEGY